MIFCFCNDTVFKLNACDNSSDQLGTSQQLPALLGAPGKLEHHRQDAGAGDATACLRRSQPHRRKRRFDRIRGPQVYPVLGRKVIKGQQGFFILIQALSRLRIFRLVSLHESIEGQVCVLARIRHPDLVQIRFGFGLQMLGQFVQYIGGLMHPAALYTGFTKHLRQRFPETQCPIADGKPGVDREAAMF